MTHGLWSCERTAVGPLLRPGPFNMLAFAVGEVPSICGDPGRPQAAALLGGGVRDQGDLRDRRGKQLGVAAHFLAAVGQAEGVVIVAGGWGSPRLGPPCWR